MADSKVEFESYTVDDLSEQIDDYASFPYIHLSDNVMVADQLRDNKEGDWYYVKHHI